MADLREGLTRVALDLCEHCLNGCTRHPNASGHGCKTAGCALQGAGARIPYEGLREHVKVMWPAPLMACVEALRPLRNEAKGMLGLERVGIAELVSETNVRCLEFRMKEADLALAAWDHYLEGEPAAQEER